MLFADPGLTLRGNFLSSTFKSEVVPTLSLVLKRRAATSTFKVFIWPARRMITYSGEFAVAPQPPSELPRQVRGHCSVRASSAINNTR